MGCLLPREPQVRSSAQSFQKTIQPLDISGIRQSEGHDEIAHHAEGYRALPVRQNAQTFRAALVIGVVVFSHWILDFIAHPRDLPIYDNTAKVGFGLWNYRDPEFTLEIGLLALGIALYLGRNVIPAIRKGTVIAFGIALVVVQIGDTYVPRAALSDKSTALGVWIFYTLFVLIAWLVEKIRARPQTSASGSRYSRP